MPKILLVEDTDIVRRSTATILRYENFEVITAKDGEEGIALALNELPDLILCDVMMPKVNGYQVLEALQEEYTTRTIPFIFLTGRDTRENVRHGMHLGADDYLTKPFTKPELLQTIQSQLKKYANIKSHYEQYIRQLEQIPDENNQYDAVTGIENFLYLQQQFDFFVNKLDNRQIRNLGTNFYLPLCLIQIEGKKIKQILSYETYNELLTETITRLKNHLENEEQVALIGDGEFAILCNPIKDRQDISSTAELIIKQFESSFMINKKEFFVDIRVGISFYPRSGHTLDELVKSCRSILENTTQFATQKYQFSSDQDNFDHDKQVFLETELHYAIARNQLQVFYQPQINLSSGTVTGLEALLRWFHPDLGFVSPVDFIPIAEETGLIESIGYWSLKEATEQVREWQRKYHESLRLAINVSAHQLSNPDICHEILRILAEEDFDPKLLDLEITESILIDDFQKANDKLKMLQRVGIKIAIDDFGTGYSSFNYTRLFPWDILKIDRCFINNIHQSKINAAITKGLIEMSHALGFKVIAEGVETSAELAVLNQYNCDEVQGYFLGRPVSGEVLERNIFQKFENVDHQ